MSGEAVWLSCVIKSLPYNIPITYSSRRHASVAVIIRANADLDVEEIKSSTGRPVPPNDSDFQVEILYIKRAERETDRWSGHVAFPGGMHSNNETHCETAIRETQEEIGLDLNDTDKFHFCGRLSDYTTSRTRTVDFAVSVFVFLQTCKETPPLQLDTKEVASVRWIPVNFFLRPPVAAIGEVPWDMNFNRKNYGARSLPFGAIPAKIFRIHTLYFPSIKLPVPLSEPTNASTENVEYNLWGMTYHITSGLFKLADEYSSSNKWMPVLFLAPSYYFRTHNALADTILDWSNQKNSKLFVSLFISACVCLLVFYTYRRLSSI